MKRLTLLLLAIVALQTALADNRKPVPFTNVHFEDVFWCQRLDTLRQKTILHAFKKCDDGGYLRNFAVAGGRMQGKFQSIYPFDDAEVYKTLEGASYLLTVQPDAKLEAYCDSVVDLIVDAQEPDGYLYTNKTINNPLHPWVGDRWEKDWLHSHETFNAGELYEAAVAYYYATGKRKLLDAAIRNADLVCHDLNEKRLVIAPGHEVIEMALVRLYEATGDRKYLEQARFFLDCRGRRPHDAKSTDMYRNGMYWQDHLPVTKQREAVGHAVRALYCYSGMADIALHLQDPAYLEAIDSLWEDIVQKKFYVTGGLGARPSCEAFGDAYELPNAGAYCETCAALANCMFNLRMFRLHGEGKYFDVLERSLYNALLSGLAITGDRYFYPNVLEVGKQGNQRSLWFGCSCCPTNLSRFIPAVPGYVYATDRKSIYVNLYVQNTADVNFRGRKLQLRQTTDYPWDGRVSLRVTGGKAKADLRLRIPGWAKGRPVPGSLYSYTNPASQPVIIRINGEQVNYREENGYAVLPRTWRTGDEVTIDLPMTPRIVKASDKVEADRGLVSVERGPIVYCAEFRDNDGLVSNLVLPEQAPIRLGSETMLPHCTEGRIGCRLLYATGTAYALDAQGQVTSQAKDIALIPYYARSHRGAGEMRVWLPATGQNIERSLRTEALTVDKVIVANKASEAEHNLQGENTRADSQVGWRDAPNGWFSYDLKVLGDGTPQQLVLTYASHDDGARHFDILVDGTKIADQSLHRETFDELIDRQYAIPAALLQGKQKVTVTVRAYPDNIAGGVFGCKILRMN